jgi:hypothetical protein
MATFIVVYHSGVVVTNEIGSYELIRMKETFLLNEILRPANVVRLVRVTPHPEIAEMKPPYVCSGCLIHTYSNNIINRCHI